MTMLSNATRWLRSRGFKAWAAIAVIATLITSSVVVYAAWGDNVHCFMGAANTENNHQVYVYGSTGFFDWMYNPVNVEVDWDDGQWSSTTTSAGGYGFYHTYNNGGLAHIKIYTEGADGAHCSPDTGNTFPWVIDLWVN